MVNYVKRNDCAILNIARYVDSNSASIQNNTATHATHAKPPN